MSIRKSFFKTSFRISTDRQSTTNQERQSTNNERQSMIDSSRRRSFGYETFGASLFDYEFTEEQPQYSEILKSEEFNVKYGVLNEKYVLGKEYRGKRIVPDSKQKKIDSSRRSSNFGGVMKITLEELVESISSTSFLVPDDIPPLSLAKSNAPDKDLRIPKYIKVNLKETPELTFFEQPSKTVPKESEDAKAVEDDNKIYDDLTVGRGKHRRKAEAETQTVNILMKSRDINTISIRKANAGAYVSNFDMFDTYKNLEQTTSEMDINAEQRVSMTTYKVGGVDQFTKIGGSKEFLLAAMITQRCLAGNVFINEQRRFRNMYLPDPLNIDIQYTYDLKVLWTYKYHALDGRAIDRRAVACISWCPLDGDIIAVCYGIYIYMTNSYHKNGCVCIWNIKNPVNPEKVYSYPVPVTCVEFSPFAPQLLAIGLFDGTVEVRDISESAKDHPVAVSDRQDARGCDAVNQIKWIDVKNIGDENEEVQDIEPLLAITQSGIIIKYKVVKSPYLVAFRQMTLDNVVGIPEGIRIKKQKEVVKANRNPQGLALRIHPEKPDVYYALTDEGSLHKCSINYPRQHMDIFQAHDGSVFCMEYSPWSPKLFLTCGTDWCIRIWLEGITTPLITLSNGIGSVNCAYWNPTNSTIIVGITKKSVEVWDIRKSTLKPVSEHELREGASHTVMKFANCGRSLVVGDERGYVYLCGLENMPFAPHFQYDALERSILRAIAAYPKMVEEVKSMGCFAYPNYAKKTQ